MGGQVTRWNLSRSISFIGILFFLSLQWSLFVNFHISDKESHIKGRDQRTQKFRNVKEKYPIIDIISIGSHSELDSFAAQWETFGSHEATRQFRFFTESDDDERDCSKILTNEAVNFISDFCRSQTTRHAELTRFRSRFAHKKYLAKKGDGATGWLCAFKRPAESLYKVLMEYSSTSNKSFNFVTRNLGLTRKLPNMTMNKPLNANIPDYLFLLDADTFINIDKMLVDGNGFLSTTYPFNKATVIAGCRIKERVREHNFTFPWGGFGTIFTRRSIERLIEPIYGCHPVEDNEDDLIDPQSNKSLKTLGHRELSKSEFSRLVCSKIKDDIVGEAFLFKEGMSVADLMYAYVTNWKFIGAQKNWSLRVNERGNNGFCLHADWVLGYFVNHYYLSSHDYTDFYEHNPEHRLVGYNRSELYAGNRRPIMDQLRECNNDYDRNCDPNTAHICHHVSAAKIRELNSNITYN